MLKLGVQLHLTPALSKACHPHLLTKNTTARKALLYMLFQLIEQEELSLVDSKNPSVSSGLEAQAH